MKKRIFYLKICSLIFHLTNKSAVGFFHHMKPKHKTMIKKMTKEELEQVIAYYLKRPSGMSWEGNARLSPRARAAQEFMYRRDCPIPLISQMHKYDYHLPKNEAVVE